MKLGLYGGSFDPIHLGHIDPVRRARQALGLDRVLYLPTARPPHKEGRRQAPALARYAMVELALLGEDGLFVSPFEMERSTPSYTVDTLEHFQQIEPWAELHLLIGADSFLELERWVRWRRIAELAKLVILPRPGFDGEVFDQGLTPPLRRLIEGEGAVVIEEPELVDVSSTGVRQRLTEDSAVLDDVLPPLVIDYIRKYELYC